MKRTIAVSIMVGGLLVFFQNCGSTVAFSNKSGSIDEKSSASLVPLAIEDDEQDMASAGSSSESSGTISQPAPAPAPAPGDNGKKNDYAVNESEDEDEDDAGAGDLVACILVDHGKSLKLGLIEQKFGGVNAVAQSVCLSRKACLEKVSKKFNVQGAYDRGYCAHNPNVVRLTDAQVDELLK